MRIQLKTIYAGPDGTVQPGVHDLPSVRAKVLVEAGAAVPVKGVEAEDSSMVPPESAENSPKPKKGRGARKTTRK